MRLARPPFSGTDAIRLFSATRRCETGITNDFVLQSHFVLFLLALLWLWQRAAYGLPMAGPLPQPSGPAQAWPTGNPRQNGRVPYHRARAARPPNEVRPSC